ncbi:hypothetical protein ACFL26_02240, partial [Patescibacteria group bacterium]
EGDSYFEDSVGIGIAADPPSTRLHLDADDASTNSVLDVLRIDRRSSGGSGAAGLGAGVQFYLENANNITHEAGSLDVAWQTATAGSEGSRISFSNYQDGSLDEMMRINEDGQIKIGDMSAVAAFTPVVHVKDLDGSTGVYIEVDSATNSAMGLYAHNAGDGPAIRGESDGGVGGQFFSTSGSSRALTADSTFTSTNTVENVLGVTRRTSGTAAVGIAAGIVFGVEASDGDAYEAGRLSVELEQVTGSDIDSAMVFETMNFNSFYERMRIDTDGNVGIGDDSPDTILDILSYSDTENTVLTISNTSFSSMSPYIAFEEVEDDPSYRVGYSKASNYFTIDERRNGGVDLRMYDGQDSWLDYAMFSETDTETNTADNVLRLQKRTSGSPTEGFGVGLEFSLDSDYGTFNSPSTAAEIQGMWIDAGSTDRHGALVFNTYDGSAGNEAMRINHLRNVGIGWSVPDYRLDIFDRDASTNSVMTAMRLQRQTSGGAGAAGLGVGMDFWLENGSSQMHEAATLDVAWEVATAGSEESSIRFSHYDNGSLSEAMRIDDNGNVGIGTTSPDVALHVEDYDASTNSVLTIAQLDRHSSGGAGAAGLGAGLDFNIENAGSVIHEAASIDALWTTATNGSEYADIVFSSMYSGAMWENARISSAGDFTAEGSVTAVGGEVVAATDVRAGDDILVPNEVRHYADTGDDTYIDFIEDQISFYAGGENLLKLTESGTDSVTIGDGGAVDIFLAGGASNSLWVEGSSGYVAVNSDDAGSLDDQSLFFISNDEDIGAVNGTARALHVLNDYDSSLTNMTKYGIYAQAAGTTGTDVNSRNIAVYATADGSANRNYAFYAASGISQFSDFVGIGSGNTVDPSAELHIGYTEPSSSTYNTVERVLRLDKGTYSGLQGTNAGFGVGLDFVLTTSTGITEEEAGAIDVSWQDPTTNAEDSEMIFYTKRAGTLSEAMRIDESGYLGINDSSPEGMLEIRSSDATTQMLISNDATDGDPSIRFRFGSSTQFTIGVDDTTDDFVIGDGNGLDAPVIGIENGTNKVYMGTTTYTDYGLNITYDPSSSAYPVLVVDRDDTDNSTGSPELVQFSVQGLEQGDITISGGTVSYNPFTGSHYGQSVDTDLENGMLLSATGINSTLHNEPGNEIIYGVEASTTENDTKIVGAYLDSLDIENASTGASDEGLLIMAVGNGRMWVVDEGTDIQAGDYLISSSTRGHARLDNANYLESYVVGRAAEDIVWDEVTETVGGKKHKKISIFFESFTRRNYNEVFTFTTDDPIAVDSQKMSLSHVVTDETTHRLSLTNELDEEIAYFGSNGDVAIRGRLYLSDRGTFQGDRYMYYDGSAGPGGDFIRTNAAGWATGSYDFAEMFPSDQNLEPGELVMIDVTAPTQVERANDSHESNGYLLAGIVSTRPGFLAGPNDVGNFPVALQGRVPTRVNGENGPISIGDPVTISTVPGVGSKASEPGYVVGIALTSFEGTATHEEGVVTVFLKTGWYNGSTVEQANEDVSGTSQSVLADAADTVNLGGNAIINVGAIQGLDGLWAIDGEGKLTAKAVEAENVQASALTVKADDERTTIGEGVIPAGSYEYVVENPMVHADSRIFVTFFANIMGNWWISERMDGRFKIVLSTVPEAEVPFEYWILDIEDARSATTEPTDDDPFDAGTTAEPPAEEPSAEEPPAEEPPAEEPPAEEPPAEEPPAEEPPAEEPPAEEPPAEEPPAEEPPAEEPPAEEPPAEEPPAEEPPVEEPPAEEPPAEEPLAGPPAPEKE